MTHKWAGVLGVMFGVLLFAAPMFAHHGAAAYDTTGTDTLKGTIEEFEFHQSTLPALFRSAR